ncbi:hypothetical protein BN3590_00007 [Clostridium sp. C105KSO15]|nr:hypothetical protein BN3590_00007 [Clostridium sp. C105KSO15]
MRHIYTGNPNQTLNIRRGQGDNKEGDKIFIHIVERDENGKEKIIRKSYAVSYTHLTLPTIYSV